MLIIFCSAINVQVFGDDALLEKKRLLHAQIKETIVRGINFVESNQIKQTIGYTQFEGEWPTLMCLEKGFLYISSKKRVYDSNCFSVASIHNNLAFIYLLYPEYEQIKPILDKAFPRIMAFKNGDRFNFWNALPPNRKLLKTDIIGKQPLVRRPNNFPLKNKFINKAANVTEDSDDTSMGYLAIDLREKIYKTDTFTKKIAPLFDAYRDGRDRKNFHWYNYLNTYDRYTDAYLTWHGKEYEFKVWYFAKNLWHNHTFFLPSSQSYPFAYVPYVPYGVNDLDGVVNANVLNVLNQYNELHEAKGFKPSIAYLEKKAARKRYERVGVYYPNRYQFPYAVSNAYYNGIKELENAIKPMREFILDNQKPDGSWESRAKVNHRDVLQSTVYATTALINMGDFEKNGTEMAIERGIKYIFDNSKKNENQIYWEGGVFFSGGTVVRNALVWKSDAYTTVLILNTLAKYRKYLEEKYNFN